MLCNKIWAQVGRRLATVAMYAGATNVRAGDNPAEVLELPTVTVVGTTPLPGLGVPLADVPANVQMFGSRALGTQRPLTPTQFLDQNATSVSATSAQGNAFQQAITFRGFAASPLL